MPIKHLNQAGYRVLIMLAQFGALLGCLIYLDYVYLTNVRPDQLAKKHFAATECFIMTKKLSTKGNFLRRYRADFLVNYETKGAVYHRWVSGDGLNQAYTRRSESQTQLLSHYDDGHNYVCWYNPDNPEEVLLVPRQIKSFLLAMILPTLMSVVALGFFLHSGWVVLRRVSAKKIAQKNKLK